MCKVTNPTPGIRTILNGWRKNGRFQRQARGRRNGPRLGRLALVIARIRHHLTGWIVAVIVYPVVAGLAGAALKPLPLGAPTDVRLEQAALSAGLALVSVVVLALVYALLTLILQEAPSETAEVP